MNLKTLIIEKNKLISDIIEDIIQLYHPNIETVKVSSCIHEAQNLVLKNNFDIILIDLKIDAKNACSFIQKLSAQIDVEIIATSDVIRHAINAYKIQASSFILKPIKQIEFSKILNKSISRLLAIKKRKLDDNEDTIPNIIGISSISGVNVLKIDDIMSLKANGRYTEFNLKNGSIKIATKNIGFYEKILKPPHFFRIHHSYIVNFIEIIEMGKAPGSYLKLSDNTTFPIAKRRRSVLGQYLGIK